MAFNVLPSLGTFRLSDGYATAELATQLTGTWDENTYGTRYYLQDTGGTGNAIAEVLKGNVLSAYRGLAATPVVDIDTSVTGYINTEYVVEPAIKWIASDGTGTWYKVIAVLDDSLIEVEKLFGSNPGVIHGAFTRGYALKSITIAATDGDVNVYGYDNNFTVPTPNIVTIPINIAISGPLYLLGDGTVTTNVPIYDNQWL